MMLRMRVRLPYKPKPNNYTESCVIDEADGWREKNVWYLGRSVRYALKEEAITESNAERTEVLFQSFDYHANDTTAVPVDYCGMV